MRKFLMWRKDIEPEHAWNWKKDKVWFETPEEFLEEIRKVYDIEDVRCVPGFRGYAVSREGRIFSCKISTQTYKKHINELTWKVMRKANSRYVVCLYVDKAKRNQTVTRALVLAMAYLPPPEPGQDRVRHRNDICDDDRLENLVWGTAKDNSQDSLRNGNTPTGERCKRAKLTNEQAKEIYRLWKEEAKTATELASQFGVSYSIVNAVVKGRAYRAITGAPKIGAYSENSDTISETASVP